MIGGIIKILLARHGFMGSISTDRTYRPRQDVAVQLGHGSPDRM